MNVEQGVVHGVGVVGTAGLVGGLVGELVVAVVVPPTECGEKDVRGSGCGQVLEVVVEEVGGG